MLVGWSFDKSLDTTYIPRLNANGPASTGPSSFVICVCVLAVQLLK
jgi:hypothetical protein